MTEFSNWELLATNAGAIAMVLLIVQFIKAPLDKLWKIPTRVIVYVLSLGILVTADSIMAGGLMWDRVGLDALNAFVVAAGAMGAYEMTFAKLDEKKEVK